MQNYSTLPEEEQTVLVHLAESTRSKWNHIEDLDSFFARMYKYHQKHGITCMVIQDVFELIQFVFMVLMTCYLFHGIDYALIFATPVGGQKVTLDQCIYPIDVLIANFTGLTWFVLVIALAVFLLKFFTRCYQIIFFWDIKQFYNTVLKIKDSDLDNMTWHEIQTRIKLVQPEQQMCIHKRELTELDIYHRILRQENYLIAMVNKKLLPPRIKVPFMGEFVYWTKGFRFNIQTLLFWSPWGLFDNPWHLQEKIKRTNMRNENAEQLGKHILYLALINLLLAPIIFFWQILYTVFNYGDLIRREPGQMGMRSWSLYAKLYLRHFNELDHELHARLTRAYKPAKIYVSAINSPLITIIAKNVGFLTGAVCTIIISLAILDEDVLTIQHLLTLFTALGGITALCRNVIPDETESWCPETLLEHVVAHTHYLPSDWRGQAHTSRIRADFLQLYQTRLAAILEDLLSPILTPYLMLKWVYPRSGEIVDFFKNFTVSIVGVGDVCSFAQMDVKKNGNREWQNQSFKSESDWTPDQAEQAEDGKVELSLVHFTTTNPSWVPPPEAAQFIESVQDEVEPLYNFEDRDMYNSIGNLDYNPSMFDARRSMRTKSDAGSASLLDSQFGAGAMRNSLWLSEGPNLMGPMNMRSSAIALHNRHYLATKNTRSLEETTPLLVPKQ